MEIRKRMKKTRTQISEKNAHLMEVLKREKKERKGSLPFSEGIKSKKYERRKRNENERGKSNSKNLRNERNPLYWWFVFYINIDYYY